MRLQHIVFLGTGNAGGSAAWVCPSGVTKVWLWGYGGGGGGGGGRGGPTVNTIFSSPGGGGGGGSEAHFIEVDVVPGTSYTVTVGAGGAAGTAGSGNAGSGGAGGNGGDSIFTDGGSVNVRFVGAHGGREGFNPFSPGGGNFHPSTDENAITGPSFTLGLDNVAVANPGAGGWGGDVTYNPSGAGARGRVQKGTNDGSTHTSGGSRNFAGSFSTGYPGGAGGGGGNGPGGCGGDGGAGGIGLNGFGFPGNWAGPTGTPNNTGAGGGGGGGGGYQPSNTIAGGAGGAGGSGKVVVSFIG